MLSLQLSSCFNLRSLIIDLGRSLTYFSLTDSSILDWLLMSKIVNLDTDLVCLVPSFRGFWSLPKPVCFGTSAESPCMMSEPILAKFMVFLCLNWESIGMLGVPRRMAP